MYYADMKRWDVANGPGVRVSLFVSGCTHHCKGCFNKEAWDFCYGKPFTEQTEDEILRELAKKAIITDLPCLAGSRLNMKIRKLWLRF